LLAVAVPCFSTELVLFAGDELEDLELVYLFIFACLPPTISPMAPHRVTLDRSSVSGNGRLWTAANGKPLLRNRATNGPFTGPERSLEERTHERWAPREINRNNGP